MKNAAGGADATTDVAPDGAVPVGTTLLEGIRQDAEREAAGLEREAEAYARNRLAAARTQADALVAAATEEAGKRREALLAAEASRRALESGKRSLRLRESVIRQAMEAAEAVCAAAVDRPDYPALLESWIVEAAVGLSAPSATVDVAARERAFVDVRMLASAQARASDLAGMEIRLCLTDSPAPEGQGVTLTADDGRTAYDNRMTARFARELVRARSLVDAELFGSGKA